MVSHTVDLEIQPKHTTKNRKEHIKNLAESNAPILLLEQNECDNKAAFG